MPDLQVIDADKISDFAPYCDGVQALWSPHTGIVDYQMVTNSYLFDFKKHGGNVHRNFKVNEFTEDAADNEYPILLKAADNSNCEHSEIHAKYVLTCGGLQSDKLAKLTGCLPSPRIIPFRGEYLLLAPEKCHFIRCNVYPVPDPKFPFLGVHFHAANGWQRLGGSECCACAVSRGLQMVAMQSARNY